MVGKSSKERYSKGISDLKSVVVTLLSCLVMVGAGEIQADFRSSSCSCSSPFSASSRSSLPSSPSLRWYRGPDNIVLSLSLRGGADSDELDDSTEAKLSQLKQQRMMEYMQEVDKRESGEARKEEEISRKIVEDLQQEQRGFKLVRCDMLSVTFPVSAREDARKPCQAPGSGEREFTGLVGEEFRGVLLTCLTTSRS